MRSTCRAPTTTEELHAADPSPADSPWRNAPEGVPRASCRETPRAGARCRSDLADAAGEVGAHGPSARACSRRTDHPVAEIVPDSQPDFARASSRAASPPKSKMSFRQRTLSRRSPRRERRRTPRNSCNLFAMPRSAETATFSRPPPNCPIEIGRLTLASYVPVDSAWNHGAAGPFRQRIHIRRRRPTVLPLSRLVPTRRGALMAAVT